MLYALVGLVAGFLSGFLGIGGGIVVVPSLMFIFPKAGMPESVAVHMALGTSSLCAFFFTLSGAVAHLRMGHVRLSRALPAAVGGAAGALLGSHVASCTAGVVIKRLFAFLLIFSAYRMAFSRPHTGGGGVKGSVAFFLAVGLAAGVVGSFFGVGGGVVVVPALSFAGFAPTEAVGTSSVLLPFITLFSSIGYAVGGWHRASLPAMSLGFIYLPAVFLVVPFGVLGAQVGARAAGAVPAGLLKRAFACLLAVVAVKIFFT